MSPNNLIKLKRVCPVCFCDKAESLYEIKFAKDKNEKIPDSYDIVACNKCGFVFNDTDWIQKDYDEYYKKSSKYSDNTVFGGGGISKTDLERYSKQIDRISKYINKDSFILDIGCAKGGLLQTLMERGYNRLFGIDPSEQCISFLNSKGIKGEALGFFDIDKLNIKFDVVILSHVAEHVYDLKSIVSSIYKILNENSIVYVEIPDSSRYIDTCLKSYYYFDLEHINHFSKLTLEYCFDKLKTLDINTDHIGSVNEIKSSILYGVFQHTKNKSEIEYKYDIDNVNKVKDYIKYSKNNDFYSIENIDESLDCFLWGGGAYLRRLLLDDRYFTKLNICGIIDKNRSFEGKKISMYNKREIPVFNPSYIEENYSRLHKKCSVIITSVLYEYEIKENLLKDKNFSGNVFTL